MARMLRWPIYLFGAFTILFLCYLNVRLYDQPVCTRLPNGGHLHSEVLDQLHFLKRKLRHERAAEEAQMLYPEGYVFLHALYALAWCDVIATLPPESRSWQDGLAEIAFSLQALDSRTGRQVFNPDLPLTYGAFYRGWTTYVRGRYLQLRTPAERDLMEVRRFREDCSAIAQAIERTEKPYLESYRDLAWPGDNVVCLAALSLHDRIEPPLFQTTRVLWLDKIRQHLDPQYASIPHSYDLDHNLPTQGVRGSSQVLMLNFLWEVDSVFARSLYPGFRQHFLAYRLGLPGIREYPHGAFGTGDIDSGPVVLGIGGVASIVGIRAAARYEDWEVWAGLRSEVNALLWPQHSGDEKQYIFGQLPVVDAFMAWSNASVCPAGIPDLGNWRWKFQVMSVVLGAACGFWMWRVQRIVRTNGPIQTLYR